MDWNTLYLELAPYINLIIVALGGGGIGTLIYKVIKIVKREIENIRVKTNIAEIFKQALPKDFSLTVEALTKTELDKLKAEIKKEFIKPLQELIELNKISAKALGNLRSVPDDIKQELSAKIDEDIKTVESIKIELSKEITEEAKPDNEPQWLPEEL